MTVSGSGVSEVSAQRLQTVAELLLLSGDCRPVLPATNHVQDGAAAQEREAEDNSFEKCRDTIVAGSKHLEIFMFDVQSQMSMGRFEDACGSVECTANLVLKIIEHAVHAAYLAASKATDSDPALPGMLDHYRMCLSRFEVLQCCNRLRSTSYCDLNARELLEISGTVSHHLKLLSEPCLVASERVCDPFLREQLKHAVKCISAAATALIACIRALKEEPGEQSHQRCVLFGAPLLESVRALLGLASEMHLSGTPAVLGTQGRTVHTAVLGGAMSVVSSCVLMFQSMQEVARRPGDREQTTKAQGRLQCAARAAVEGCAMLLQALRDAMPSRFDTNGINLL
uniref:Talin rod domain containing 1 n=1 Tax=Eptatretus burgeri TaxID=7764 RepID=A0A8C4WZT1_EPTBU